MPSYFDSPQYKNSPAGRGAPLQRTPGFNTPFGSPGSNFGSGGSPFSGFSSGFASFPQGSGGGLTSSAPLGLDLTESAMPDPFNGAPQQSGNIATHILDWAKQNPKDALGVVGNVANSVMGYRQMSKQNKLAEQDAAMRKEEYERRRRNDESMSPARAQVLQALLARLRGGR